MSEIRIVETQTHHVNGIALIEESGAVWFTFSRPWWDLASWLWWLLAPGEKRWAHIRDDNNKKVRIRAVHMATKYLKVGT